MGTEVNKFKTGDMVVCEQASFGLIAGGRYEVESFYPDEDGDSVCDLVALKGFSTRFFADRFRRVSDPQPEAHIDVKDTNPKDAIGITKSPLSVLPMRVVFEVGLALMEGALKYGRHNYRIAGVRGSVYFDAAMRHLAAWWEGEDIDPDSGVHHLSKAAACLVVIRDSQMQRNWVDDRPPRVVEEGWIQKFNEKAKALLEKHPAPVQPWTQMRVEQRPN